MLVVILHKICCGGLLFRDPNPNYVSKHAVEEQYEQTFIKHKQFPLQFVSVLTKRTILRVVVKAVFKFIAQCNKSRMLFDCRLITFSGSMIQISCLMNFAICFNVFVFFTSPVEHDLQYRLPPIPQAFFFSIFAHSGETNILTFFHNLIVLGNLPYLAHRAGYGINDS